MIAAGTRTRTSIRASVEKINKVLRFFRLIYYKVDSSTGE